MVEFVKELSAGVFDVVQVGPRGQYSPSVVAAYLKDPSWFNKSMVLAESQDRDLEGFDQYGYDAQGQDRAGLTVQDYGERWYYDVNDDHIDDGEDKYLRVLSTYTLQWDDGMPLICLDAHWPALSHDEFVSGWQCSIAGALYLD